MKIVTRILFLVIIFGINNLYSQDGFLFKGQLSGWAHFNPKNELNIWTGGRYIPEINYSKSLGNKTLLDLEISANIYGSLGIKPFDSTSVDGNTKAYRAWLRFSGEQFELRAGLQKINFGPSTILRPLMWFDRLDPRDPLQLTDGVWGVLGRYYFLNNANFWIWGLYGNNKTKGWEIMKTLKNTPEFGGRLQFPVPKGETAITYHYRRANSFGLEEIDIPLFEEIPEHRIGIDGRWDFVVGAWFEGTWIHKNKNVGEFTNETFLNIGIDYTFGIGNGLHILNENILVSFDEKAFSFNDKLIFSAISVSYPIGLFDNINTIIYYDWKNSGMYSFINWQRSFDNWMFYLMAYWNPENYNIPLPGTDTNLYAGKGIQIMIVFNH